MKIRDIEKDLALCEAATKGPWRIGINALIVDANGKALFFEPGGKTNAAFIAAAREALPYWLKEVKRLDRALEMVCADIAADDCCPVDTATEFDLWEECHSCPANTRCETYQDTARDAACWKRYYMELTEKEAIAEFER